MGSDKSTPNDLDIWGNLGKDCFYCSKSYRVEESTATPDYRSTYCSIDCEAADLRQLRAASQLDIHMDSGKNLPDDRYEIRHVGDFKLKVRKEGN